MAVHAFTRLMDEAPQSLGGADVEIDAGPLQATGQLLGSFELEIPAGPLIATGVLAGNSQIDIMVYANPLIGHTQLLGQWSPGTPTTINAGALQATAQLKGEFSSGDSEVLPLQAIGILRGQARISPAAGIPYFHIELRDSDGELKFILARNIGNLRWDTDPIRGGCKSASFSLVDPPIALDEANLNEYDVRIMVDPGPGIDCWWRGYLQNPRLALDHDRYVMSFSALGWIHRLNTESIVGLGFPIEDGGVRFANLDAAEIVRQLIDRANIAGAGLAYDPASVPDSGFVVSSIQFNSQLLDAIQVLAELAGEAEWGVDRRKRFYFRASTITVDRVFFIGADIAEMVHDFDHDGVVNRIYLFGAGGRRWVLEDTATLTADVSQSADDSTIAFGKATSNQRLVQTFTTARSSLSAIDLKIGKTGWGSNLVTDGDMELAETSAPANWGKIWDRTRRTKVTSDPYEGVRALEVRHARTGKGRYGVFQDVTVTPDQRLLFSARIKDPEREDPVTVDLVDGQTGDTPARDSDPIILRMQGSTRDTTWHRLSGSATPTTNLIGIRIWSHNRKGGTGKDPFYIDDVRMMAASDVIVSVVERTSTSPLRFDETNPIATAIIPFEDIPDTPAVLRLSMVAFPLDATKTYGILIEIDGDLNDSQYFLLAHNSASSGLNKDDGAGWSTVSGGAYHITYLPSGQIAAGVRSITIDRPQIDNDTDAAVFGASYLANRGSPIERGFVRLKPNRNILIEEDQPVKLVRITRGK